MTVFWIFMAAFGWSCRNLEGGQYRAPFTVAAIFCLVQAIGVTQIPIPRFDAVANQQYQQLEQQR